MPINIPFHSQYEYLESSPCSAVLNVTPFVDNFHKLAISAIRIMLGIYGAALIFFFIPIVNNGVLFNSLMFRICNVAMYNWLNVNDFHN